MIRKMILAGRPMLVASVGTGGLAGGSVGAFGPVQRC
jgi:hypothetical protein